MLIKHTGINKFIFIANPKCASSIKASGISKIGDIKIVRSPLGKHMSMREVYDRCGCIFENQEFSLDKFFK
ncbi:hypothetical protein Cyast_1982 [Cyanobacterium stanieri PCC 7202]|uniref:Uncharacterized protein n=1 Tax=Cyanobacterium stanieri (strain ATCC 29140 / PCC 7202) TaxID=292563 RepID=K9YNE5_CYASC|nr:hypothetical protein Cyast_1982 [Cyanobacterium stanieri PCC 7202]